MHFKCHTNWLNTRTFFVSSLPHTFMPFAPIQNFHAHAQPNLLVSFPRAEFSAWRLSLTASLYHQHNTQVLRCSVLFFFFSFTSTCFKNLYISFPLFKVYFRSKKCVLYTGKYSNYFAQDFRFQYSFLFSFHSRVARSSSSSPNISGWQTTCGCFVRVTIFTNSSQLPLLNRGRSSCSTSLDGVSSFRISNRQTVANFGQVGLRALFKRD